MTPPTTDRLETLLQLLGDRSPTVWRHVRRGLRDHARAARAGLGRAARSDDPRERARARQLLLELDRERASRRLVGYALRPKVDLERALFLLARFEEPGLDARPFLAALDAMAAEVMRRAESRPPGSERARVLVDYLADELGYDGSGGDYHHPDNVYLHRAIVRRRGLPLTLVAIYLFVARRAGISAAPVALPGHVVLRLHGNDRNLLIDPFNQGAELSERECLSYLAARGLSFSPEWFADASDAKMFVRQIRNLCVSYRRRGLGREVELISRVLFARRDAEPIAEAAR